MPVRIDEIVSDVSAERAPAGTGGAPVPSDEEQRRERERRAGLDARLRPEDPDA